MAAGVTIRVAKMGCEFPFRKAQGTCISTTECDVFKRQLGINSQFRRENLDIDFACGKLKRPAKLFKSIPVNRDTGSHFQSAELFQMASAWPEGVDKREPRCSVRCLYRVRSRQSRPATWAMMSFHDPGSDDPEHPMMPFSTPSHNAGMA